MWNPFKTLSERDAERLRDVLRRVQQLEDDNEQLFHLTQKIHARLRGRSKRDLDSSAEPDAGGSEIVGGIGNGADTSDRFGTAPVQAPATADAPRFTRDELRQFAKARGLR